MNTEGELRQVEKLYQEMGSGETAQEAAPIRIGHCKIHGPHGEAEAIAVAYAQRAEVLGQIESAERMVEVLRAENQRLHAHIHRLNRVVRTALEL